MPPRPMLTTFNGSSPAAGAAQYAEKAANEVESEARSAREPPTPARLPVRAASCRERRPTVILLYTFGLAAERTSNASLSSSL
jgi:hypothetical protein